MMRVNLLPREPETVRIAGSRIDRGDLRRLTALALLFTMALLAASSAQIWRGQRLQALAAQTERRLEIDAPLRNRVAALAREVALLQRIDRESALARHTGNDAAEAVARLGNAIPNGAWLNAIDRRPDGYLVSGGALDLTTIAQTLNGLDRAAPLSRARLAGIGAADGSLTFNIRVISQRGLIR